MGSLLGCITPTSGQLIRTLTNQGIPRTHPLPLHQPLKHGRFTEMQTAPLKVKLNERLHWSIFGMTFTLSVIMAPLIQVLHAPVLHRWILSRTSYGKILGNVTSYRSPQVSFDLCELLPRGLTQIEAVTTMKKRALKMKGMGQTAPGGGTWGWGSPKELTLRYYDFCACPENNGPDCNIPGEWHCGNGVVRLWGPGLMTNRETS